MIRPPGRGAGPGREASGHQSETLRNRVTRAEIDDGVPPGTTTDGAARIAEPENRELRRANGISKTASAFFAQAEFERRPK